MKKRKNEHLVRDGAEKLDLPKNSNGLYNHNGATNFKATSISVLKGTYNPIDAGCGMAGLARKPSKLSKTTTTTVATAQSVLNEAKRIAKVATNSTDTTAGKL
jgi:hypothetical protein